MNRTWLAAAMLVAFSAAGARAAELPVVKGKKIVATVQGEHITLDALNEQLADPSGAPRRVDDRTRAAVLRRMIDVVLIAQEGRRMDLDKLPETRKLIDSYARVALREQLVDRIVKDIKTDPAAVRKMYEDAVREWKVSAALFTTEADASAMASEVGSGKDFLTAGRARVAAGTATKVEEGIVLKRGTADPTILQAVSRMKAGAISPVVMTKAGPVLLKVEEIRYPDDPQARATAERSVMAAKRKDAVTAYDQKLKKAYVKIDQSALKALDYEAPTPGIDALMKDQRVLAEVKGETPVTIADLTEELRFKFFHGTELAAQSKRLNAKKEETLDALLHRRVFRKEALRLGLDRTEDYRGKVREYENATLFDAVVRKAIAKDVTVTEQDAKAYYESHRDAYATPEMMRIRSLAFADRKHAEAAVESLKTGADFGWVANRAEGQLDREAPGVLTFDSKPVMTTELPDDLRKAVSGARAGEVRLYASSGKQFYALVVDQVVPAGHRPYDEVRGEVSKKVAAVKMQKAIDDYADRLRSLSEVKVYLGDGGHAAR